MQPKGPSDTSDRVEPKKAKKGNLRDKLSAMLNTQKLEPTQRPVDDSLPLRAAAIESLSDVSGRVHGSSDDIGREMDRIAADRAARGVEVDPGSDEKQAEEKAHLAAIEELSGEHVVVPGPDEIEKKEREILQRQQNGDRSNETSAEDHSQHGSAA